MTGYNAYQEDQTKPNQTKTKHPPPQNKTHTKINTHQERNTKTNETEMNRLQ